MIHNYKVYILFGGKDLNGERVKGYLEWMAIFCSIGKANLRENDDKDKGYQ